MVSGDYNWISITIWTDQSDIKTLAYYQITDTAINEITCTLRDHSINIVANAAARKNVQTKQKQLFIVIFNTEIHTSIYTLAASLDVTASTLSLRVYHTTFTSECGFKQNCG